MCGGDIISDFIPASRARRRRLTADDLRPGLHETPPGIGPYLVDVGMEEAQADSRCPSPSPAPAAAPSSSKKLPPTYHFRNPAIEIDDLQPPTFLPFQLQFDKPISSRIAEWNPKKDLLAMVTEDSKILLHRFNWQRCWTVSPGSIGEVPILLAKPQAYMNFSGEGLAIPL